MSGVQDESKSETVAMKVTPSEDRAIRFVADGRGISRSELLRERTVPQIVEEYRAMRARLGLTEAA